MSPHLSEDDIDDLLYMARAGEEGEFRALKAELCQRENIAVLELLELARDEGSGNGVLHMAAANGHAGLIQELCKDLSDPSPQNPPMLAIINGQNTAGNTALHWAALNGHLESVKVLLEQGSDPTITNQRGHDAVYEAELNDKKEVVEWVLTEGGEGLEEAVGGDTGDGDETSPEENMETEQNPGAEEVEISTKLREELGKIGIQEPTSNT
ncbi:Ankyrin [Venustampulla echinocandica]|uniref:Ankyrin n=1 Tax=Venustampulla echinocandica TaxID=2656787 RepID=A0A370TT58_9HELO|nr:Ankyrin [Venustampulla echinocandica]RDL38721.1 Ankyrin [Venustampulla echinocandica]